MHIWKGSSVWIVCSSLSPPPPPTTLTHRLLILLVPSPPSTKSSVPEWNSLSSVSSVMRLPSWSSTFSSLRQFPFQSPSRRGLPLRVCLPSSLSPSYLPTSFSSLQTLLRADAIECVWGGLRSSSLKHKWSLNWLINKKRMRSKFIEIRLEI